MDNRKLGQLEVSPIGMGCMDSATVTDKCRPKRMP